MCRENKYILTEFIKNMIWMLLVWLNPRVKLKLILGLEDLDTLLRIAKEKKLDYKTPSSHDKIWWIQYPINLHILFYQVYP